MKSKIIDDLTWRYATKKFDPKKKVSKKDLDELLEVLRLSPSSYGLQPWKFLVITDKKIREKLRPRARGQAQVTDASHLIVLCARTDIDGKYIRKYIESIIKVRGVTRKSLKAYEDRMNAVMKSKSHEEREEWASRQVCIALGMLMAACAQKRIDCCPMEGFERGKFDEILELEKSGLKSVVLCPIGYRGADDFAKNKKVRFDKGDVFGFI
ncbi:MAG: NAD(P)H-dependent oxidoreductase [Candidatus Aenigmarchaeota archaeon]|nr:NAD(P)H-dependent oxidoreductase [Candidatus Aenigmarchaeota archaeon]